MKFDYNDVNMVLVSCFLRVQNCFICAMIAILKRFNKTKLQDLLQ